MVRVISAGGTARVVLDRVASRPDVDDVVAGVRHCAAIGVEELVIAIPEYERGWLEVLEEALVETPDPLRIWVAVGDTGPDGSDRHAA